MYRNNNKYSSCQLWNNGDSTLKQENYNLNAELSKVKKSNSLLQQEKKNLESRLVKLEHQLQNTSLHKVKPQFPEDVEKLLNKVENEVKTELHSKIEDLMGCITCIICNEKIKSVVYLNCRHLVACIECNKNLKDICPLCRLNSQRVVIYH